jgi:hypothetical protein
MSESEILLAVLCVGEGLFISYQWTRIQIYRNTLALATYALEQAYVAVTESKEDN